MDNEQAKFLLSACQPSGDDTAKRDIAEALVRAKRDPELMAWFTRERESDAAIIRKMRELEPPAELRARVLAGGRVSWPARNRLSFLLPLGMAAAIAVVLGLAWMWRGPDAPPQADLPPLIAWQEASVGIFAAPDFALDVVDPEYPALEAHLVASGAQVIGELPFNDSIMGTLGCKVLEFNGATVSLACFFTGTGDLVHIFTMPRGVVDETLVRDGVHRAQVGAYSTVSWLRDDRLVMIASPLPAAQLDKVFATGTEVAEASSRPRLVHT